MIEPDENSEHRGPCHIVIYGIPAGVSAANFLADQTVVRPECFEHCEMYEKGEGDEKRNTAFCWFKGGPRTMAARKAFGKGI